MLCVHLTKAFQSVLCAYLTKAFQSVLCVHLTKAFQIIPYACCTCLTLAGVILAKALLIAE